jgi:hypothetical protein
MSNRLKSFLLFAVALIVIYLLSGCSATWHIKRAEQKDPTLFIRDTVVRIDTIKIAVARTDTLFRFKYDTVEFVKDSIRIKYFHSYKDSAVYIDVECPECVQTAKTTSTTEIIQLKPGKKQIWGYRIEGVIAFVILAIIAFFVTQVVKIVK